ncbi:MAG: hypothetical protein ACI9Y7_002537 [Dokdonia sp.]|jgi:hypothetical protein
MYWMWGVGCGVWGVGCGVLEVGVEIEYYSKIEDYAISLLFLFMLSRNIVM